MRPTRWTSVASITFGILLLQLAWQLTVPAFRGIDEIDHAYRAATVMNGQIAPSREYAADGRGLIVRVPANLVEAAAPACAALTYVGPDNCVAMSAVDQEGNVAIASAAAEYSPIYYATVGWPLVVSQGEAALYLMRLTSSLAVTLLLGISVFLAVARRQTWLLLGIVMCLTPTMLYSSVVVAPNGLAMAGGVLMWTSWLLVNPRDPFESPGLLIVGAIGAASTMVGHNTGLLWAATTMLIFAFLWWPVALSRHTASALALPLATIAVAGIATFSWMIYSGATVPRGEAAEDVGVASAVELLAFPILWLFQSFFSAPRAGGFSHPVLYAVAIGSLFIFCAVGYRRAGPRIRLAGVSVVLVITAVPLFLTWTTQEVVGLAWQGRYALPLSTGIVLLAASALGRSVPFRRLHLLYLLPVLITAAIGFDSARANVASEGAVFVTPPWIAPVLAVLAVCAIWRGVELARVATDSSRHIELSGEPGASGSSPA